MLHPGLCVTLGISVFAPTHLLLELVFPVVDGDGVVVPVEAMDEGLDRGLLQMAQVGGGLAWLLSQHHHVWVDQSEGINYYLQWNTGLKDLS